MEQYKSLVSEVLNHGELRSDRTGIGTLSLFGVQRRYDLRNNKFPLVTLKKTHFSSIVKELLWFLRGETNIKTLGCGIWDQWANEEGELGPVYGKQWRDWEWRDVDGGMNGYGSCDHGYNSEDQIKELIQNLKSDPMSRRHIVSAWNLADLYHMRLQPCHVMFQCYASEIPWTEIIGARQKCEAVTRRLSEEEKQEQWQALVSQLKSIEVKVQRFNTPLLFEMTGNEDWSWYDKLPKYYLDLQLYQRSADLLLGVN